MNLERDLQKLKKEKQLKESAVAQLRKRSKDSIARPKAEKNILSTDPRMQIQLLDQKQKKIFYQQTQGCKEYNVELD
jgi:hypothetical protein